jgi:hypothetical protein
MKKKKIKILTSGSPMISAFLTASGALLKRKTKLLFLLCFLIPSVVYSYEFPPEQIKNWDGCLLRSQDVLKE